ncbi:hypothetical protein [Variibacter gotjawalensis]|uniref:hypothetical protein n=1 Tax=Variibacter gotjawalensis TaxID=1333996 RepID=UPI00102AB506|nr:hypothetical protein [Variibacter gotjawalensis]NIK48358.1 hypothetical protein [Variibacter gotjawalensis]
MAELLTSSTVTTKAKTMKRIAIVAAALALGFTFSAPASAQIADASDVSAQTTIVKKKVIRHDRGRHMHRGWRHSRHHGATRSKTVIKHRGGTTIVKKKVVR